MLVRMGVRGLTAHCWANPFLWKGNKVKVERAGARLSPQSLVAEYNVVPSAS